ncbi:MAG: lipid-binding SYLF domain-containing protein, partial [Nitrospiraceae bacterium]
MTTYDTASRITDVAASHQGRNRGRCRGREGRAVGFQIGGDVSEVVFVVRSQSGLEQFDGSQFKLGMNIGVAAGPMGGGMGLEGLTADLFVYTRAKGAFVGTALKGGLIAVMDKASHMYYGRPVTPTDSLVKRTIINPQSQDLRTAMAEA